MQMSPNGKRRMLKFKRNYPLYLMALPAMALLFMFAYMPLAGLIVAFKEYRFDGGIFGSPWINPWYKNFEILFNNSSAFTAIRNTLFLNALFIVFGTAFALMLALAFNELRSQKLKKITQSLTFLPYFISTVVVGIFVTSLLGFETGSINGMMQVFGLEKVPFYMEPNYWPVIMVIVNIWKGAGYGAIVYLAAIMGIDTSFYEAAEIDGATRVRQIWHITLPLLRPTIIVLTIMSVGKIMNSDFGLFYNVTRDMPPLYPTVDVIDTYIYRTLRKMGDIGMSSATGFFQSVVGFILVIFSNKLANKVEQGSALF
jgi:ABC-type polysaccharide transport system, permease component